MFTYKQYLYVKFYSVYMTEHENFQYKSIAMLVLYEK